MAINLRDRVKLICKQRKMTQKDLAKKLDITDVGLNATLRKGNPQLNTLVAIADALNVTVADLVSPKFPATTSMVKPSKEQVKESPKSVPQNGSKMFCPHCGKELEIFVKVN